MTNAQVNTAAALELAELVLSMNMATDRGLVARRLARQVLGVADHGQAPEVTAITTNGTTRLVPRKEPVFLLRGQDQHAAAAVRHWIELATRGGAEPAILNSALAQARLMDEWPKKKAPDAYTEPEGGCGRDCSSCECGGETRQVQATVRRPLVRCAANNDGECDHPDCPQTRDKEPTSSGRSCPLWVTPEEY